MLGDILSKIVNWNHLFTNYFCLLPFLSLLSGSIFNLVSQHNKSFSPKISIFFSIVSTISIFFILLFYNSEFASLRIQWFKIFDWNFYILLSFDSLARLMMALISFMSLIISLYSLNYLRSDCYQARFMSQLYLVSFFALTLVASGNLLTAYIGWQGIGLSLYLLLNHNNFCLDTYKASKDKFLINRIGDMAFLIAIVLVYYAYHTSEYKLIFSSPANDIIINGLYFNVPHVVMFLLVLAIMTKSAQFPFHLWLPNTMQAPSPISALMHAGLINSGAYLLARMSPWLSHLPDVLNLVFIVGALSALLGGLWMLVQPDVKRQLAYSTMSQMGYMMVQCGLGLWNNAIFHLIAHGIFKATSFLHAGQLSSSYTFVKDEVNSLFYKVLYFSLIMVAIMGITYSLYIHDDNMVMFFISFLSIWHFFILAEKYPLKIKYLFLFSTLILLLLTLYNNIISFLGHYLGSAVEFSHNHISIYSVAVIILIACIQLFCLFMSLHTKKLNNFSRYLYVNSINQSYIYRFYDYLINGVSQIGDAINFIFLHNKYLLKLINIFVIFSILAWGLVRYYHFSLPFSSDYFILFNVIIYISFTFLATRIYSSSIAFLMSLSIGQFALVALSLWTGIRMSQLGGILGLFCFAVVLGGISFIFYINRKFVCFNVIEDIAKRGKVNSGYRYLSFLLFLLIGLPGTLSFVVDFLIFLSIIPYYPWLVILLAVGQILLAIAVFNFIEHNLVSCSHSFTNLPIYLNNFLQLSFNVFFIMIILSGTFPSWYIQVLNSII